MNEAEGHLKVDLGEALREIRGELAGIRTRLDSLAAIEQQLRYQGQRLGAIEKRLATLVETRLKPEPAAKGRDASPWDVPST